MTEEDPGGREVMANVLAALTPFEHNPHIETIEPRQRIIVPQVANVTTTAMTSISGPGFTYTTK